MQLDKGINKRKGNPGMKKTLYIKVKYFYCEYSIMHEYNVYNYFHFTLIIKKLIARTTIAI